jgi:hypothetical protein
MSYWQDAADGGFRVYLGDSSALPGLPSRGSFTVTGSTSSR